MEVIKRKIDTLESSKVEILYYGFNSKGTLTMHLSNDSIININGEELKQLRQFLSRIE